MFRTSISEEVWGRLESIFVKGGAKRARHLRLRVEAVVWRLRTGAPWRDLPTEFGRWSTVYSFFNRWSRKGLWKLLFEQIRCDVDNEWGFIDSTYVKVHQHASGARGSTQAEESIGISRGGNTSKLHTRCDSHGNPTHFLLSPGNVSDFQIAGKLLENCQAESVIADKGYDSGKVRILIGSLGAVPIIPNRKTNFQPNPHFDAALYRLRHIIENLFARMKHFRAIATRYDKRGGNFMSFVYLAASLIWARL